MSGMRVLVTGAGGFLGGAFAGAALDDQLQAPVASLRVTARREQAIARFAQKGAQVVVGDLEDAEFCEKACRGIDAIVHCAGRSGLSAPMKTFAVNISTTRNMLRAAQRAGVQRFINIGTPSVGFNFRDQEQVREDQIPKRLADNYSRSKLIAEQEVLAANSDGLTTLSLRPRFTSGYGETNILGRFARMHAAGRFRRIGDGQNRVDFTAVGNVVQAIDLALAATAGRVGGEAFNITNGAPVQLWPFLDSVMQRLDLGSIPGRTPYAVARMAGAVVEGATRLFGKEPPVSRLGAAIMARTFTLDIGKARDRLGYMPRQTNEQMTDDFIRWWKETNE
ncbi:MAG: NAD-dependent epimerase/dehydratase family protein [Candidatus Dadabacteria bacterium]|nr:MAG: NAD-dependent epimerase/dehydratase family protein [Candidatus Dadabacteria bacterium]